MHGRKEYTPERWKHVELVRPIYMIRGWTTISGKIISVLLSLVLVPEQTLLADLKRWETLQKLMLALMGVIFLREKISKISNCVNLARLEAG